MASSYQSIPAAEHSPNSDKFFTPAECSLNSSWYESAGDSTISCSSSCSPVDKQQTPTRSDTKQQQHLQRVQPSKEESNSRNRLKIDWQLENVRLNLQQLAVSEKPVLAEFNLDSVSRLGDTDHGEQNCVDYEASPITPECNCNMLPECRPATIATCCRCEMQHQLEQEQQFLKQQEQQQDGQHQGQLQQKQQQQHKFQQQQLQQHRVYCENDLRSLMPASRRSNSMPNIHIHVAALQKKFDQQQVDNASKQVRFADALGFDLQCVYFVPDSSTPPLIPLRVLAALHSPAETASSDTKASSSEWQALFSRPQSGDHELQSMLRDRRVYLESASLCDRILTARVSVVNLAYEKLVSMRVTFNNWKDWQDYPLRYSHSTSREQADRFHLNALLPQEIASADRVEFAVRYQCNGCEFWDNNYQRNFIIQRERKAPPTCDCDE